MSKTEPSGRNGEKRWQETTNRRGRRAQTCLLSFWGHISRSVMVLCVSFLASWRSWFTWFYSPLNQLYIGRGEEASGRFLLQRFTDCKLVTWSRFIQLITHNPFPTKDWGRKEFELIVSSRQAHLQTLSPRRVWSVKLAEWRVMTKGSPLWYEQRHQVYDLLLTWQQRAQKLPDLFEGEQIFGTGSIEIKNLSKTSLNWNASPRISDVTVIVALGILFSRITNSLNNAFLQCHDKFNHMPKNTIR